MHFEWTIDADGHTEMEQMHNVHHVTSHHMTKFEWTRVSALCSDADSLKSISIFFILCNAGIDHSAICAILIFVPLPQVCYVGAEQWTPLGGSELWFRSFFVTFHGDRTRSSSVRPIVCARGTINGMTEMWCRSRCNFGNEQMGPVVSGWLFTIDFSIMETTFLFLIFQVAVKVSRKFLVFVVFMKWRNETNRWPSSLCDSKIEDMICQIDMMATLNFIKWIANKTMLIDSWAWLTLHVYVVRERTNCTLIWSECDCVAANEWVRDTF